jgi:hypothetical protein
VNFFAEIGSGLPSAPGVPLEVQEPAAFTSYSPLGIQLPPLFDPSSDSTQAVTLFGSTDARTSVIRIERLLGRCEGTGAACLADTTCGGSSCDLSSRLPSFDLRYCISAGGCVPGRTAPARSPRAARESGAILPATTAEIDGFVPLENLNVCRNVMTTCCCRRAPAGAVRDATPVFAIATPTATRSIPRSRCAMPQRRGSLPPLAAEGVAVTASTKPCRRKVRSLSGRGAAPGTPGFGRACQRRRLRGDVLAEPDEGESDDNDDGESFDPLLRVYCPDASGNLVQKAIGPAGNPEKLAVVARPSVLAPGGTLSPLQPGLEPLVIAGGHAVFLLDEPGNAEQLGDRADVADQSLGGAPAVGPGGSPAVDASGDVVCFEATRRTWSRRRTRTRSARTSSATTSRRARPSS